MGGKLNKINKFFGTSDYFGNNNTTPLIRELTEILMKKKWKAKEINDFMGKVSNLESEAYNNGYDNASKEMTEYQ